MSTGNEVILLDDVWVQYNGVPVLEGVNLSVRERDFIGIIGPNGGGKTTLLKVLLGLEQPVHGRVRVLGKPPREARRSIGYVPQQAEFDREFPVSVWDVVMMGRIGRRGLFRRYNRDDRRAVSDALAKVDMLDHRDEPIGPLSGGQRQRVYIARALTSDPEILLLDEPTASVDSRVMGNVYGLLQELNEHVTIVLVSHDVGIISSYVKTVACLNRRLIYHASKQITPDMLEAAYLCPVDLIAHGIPHRVFDPHPEEYGR
jgi:zinc transport system ATP-binding protein